MSYDRQATPSRQPGAPLPPGRAELHLDPDDRPLWMMARLSAVSLRLLDKIEQGAEGVLPEDERQAIFGKLDLVTAYARLARAMRQIAVLEAEMVGEREPAQGRVWTDADRMPSILPGIESSDSGDDGAGDGEPSGLSDGGSDLRDRSDIRDPDDLDDYDRRSAGEVIHSLTEQIRAQAEALGIRVDGLYAPPGYDPANDKAACPWRPAAADACDDARAPSAKRSRGPPQG